MLSSEPTSHEPVAGDWAAEDWEELDLTPAEPVQPVLRGPARRRVIVALVLVALVAAGLVGTDQRVRHDEYAALLRCVTAGQAAISAADANIAAIGSYIAGALTPSASRAVRSSIYAVVAAAASRREGEVIRAQGTCHRVTVFGVHHRLALARSAYVRYLDAKAAYLHRITRNGHLAYSAQPGLTDAFDAAQSALLAAAPGRAARAAANAALRAV